MNRFKTELRRRGIKLECDYEFLPSFEGIQTVIVNSERARVIVAHTSIVIVWEMSRGGELKEVEWY